LKGSSIGVACDFRGFFDTRFAFNPTILL
jgi:hypothetical protein